MNTQHYLNISFLLLIFNGILKLFFILQFSNSSPMGYIHIIYKGVLKKNVDTQVGGSLKKVENRLYRPSHHSSINNNNIYIYNNNFLIMAVYLCDEIYE